MNPVTLSAYVANNTVPPVSIRAELIDECLPVLRIDVPQSHSGIVATSSGKVLRRRLKADGTPENVPMYPTEMATRLYHLQKQLTEDNMLELVNKGRYAKYRLKE